MKIVVKGRYTLKAPWHTHNGKEVEVVMKRKGISQAYRGETVYHIATDPDETYRNEDLDEEFIADNFGDIEMSKCLVDFSYATDEMKKKFSSYMRSLKKNMFERIHVVFEEKYGNEFPSPEEDYLCIFYLVEDKNGNVGLTLDRENGEIISVELKEKEESQTKKEKDGSKRLRRRK